MTLSAAAGDSRPRAARRLHAAFACVLVAVAGAGCVLGALSPLAAEKARLRAKATPLYFPSSRTVRFLSVGHPSTLADLLYLWSIQYFGDTETELADRRGWLVRVYGTITDLDPRFRDAYWLGFVSLLVEARSATDAFALADKALENDPDFVLMAIEATVTARQLKREDLARRYIRIADRTGDLVSRRLRNVLEDWETVQQERAAWEALLDEDDEFTRRIAEVHVRDLQVLVDTAALSALARCHAREHVIAPATLQQLVTTGYLREIPTDPEGNEYLYDPRTLEVKSVTPYRFPVRARVVDLSALGRCAPAEPVPVRMPRHADAPRMRAPGPPTGPPRPPGGPTSPP